MSDTLPPPLEPEVPNPNYPEATSSGLLAGKTSFYRPARKNARVFTSKDVKRIYKYAKQDAINSGHSSEDILTEFTLLAIELVIDNVPFFAEWMCLYLEFQALIKWLTVSLGLIKIIKTLQKWVQILRLTIVIEQANAFFKKGGAIKATYAGMFIVALDILYETVMFFDNNAFGLTFANLYKKAYCNERDEESMFGDMFGEAAKLALIAALKQSQGEKDGED
jgi:hypothetical protein